MKHYQAPELQMISAEETDIIRTSPIGYISEGVGDVNSFDYWV